MIPMALLVTHLKAVFADSTVVIDLASATAVS